VTSVTVHRRVYRHASMARLLSPRAIAIVGASPREGSFGQRVASNLTDYDGELFLINGRYENIGGRQCFGSVSALPQVPDCVIVAAARDAVEGILRECTDIGVGGAIVYASGYSETGRPQYVELQNRLTDIASESDLRLIGPNCIGPCNFVTQATMSFGPLPRNSQPRGRSIGIISQSGAIGQGLMQAIEHGTSVSHTLTSGNSADVDVADLVSYLADDPSCHAIACVFEGLTAPARMVEAAGIAAAANKPLVVYKMATGAQGAAAAMSHTGSLAGSNEAYRTVFETEGAVVVDRLEELVETAVFFAKARRPTAPGVAVLSTTGGGAVICADKAEVYGVNLPQPGPVAQQVLDEVIPEFGSSRNPCDITAQVLNNPASLRACVDALMGDDAFGVIVHPHPVAYDGATPRIATLGEIAAEHGKMACVVWMNQWLEGPGAREGEANPHVAIFRSMDSCVRAIGEWNRRETRLQPSSNVAPVRLTADARRRAVEILDAARGPVLGERESKRLLEAYGVPVIAERTVQSRQEALDAAADLGFPVVLKVDSRALPHKTDAGVVALNIKSGKDLAAAFDKIMANALAATTPDHIQGVLVQSMAAPGVEVIVGAKVDAQFGPLVVVGLGGIFVELLRDTVTGLAPVDRREALSMIRSLKHAEILNGHRGSAAVDLEALADIVARISLLVSDHADRVAELDVNPLICAGTRVVAVDGLCLLNNGGGAKAWLDVAAAGEG
jgi:acetate---CoA ligase (ADP-forming)